MVYFMKFQRRHSAGRERKCVMTRLNGNEGWVKRAWLWGGAVLAVTMLMHLAVNLNMTVYSDDYWYGTFFRGGLREFIRNTINHYQTNNGRMFVHILVCLFLLTDIKLFAVLSPVLTAAIFLLGLRIQDKKLGGGTLLLASGLGLLSLLGSEIQYLRMSLYWISAYFNYAFPILFPLMVLWGMGRALERKLPVWGTVGLCLCAFLSGAGTEQCGLIALVLICGYWLLASLRRRPMPVQLLLYPAFAIAGYLTILMAPGSHARIARGIDGGIFSALNPAVFTTRFFEVMDYLCGYPFWNCLFAALCLLAGLVCLFDKSLPRHLLSGLPAAGLTLLMAAMGWQAPLAVFTVLYTVYLAVVFLLCPEYQTTALLLMGAGASVMMLIITTLYYARTFFPCLLLVLMVCWSLLFRVLALAQCPKAVSVGALAVLAAVFVVRYIPIYQGYAANHVEVEKNLQAIRDYQSGGELELSIDLEADYRFTMFFEGTYFYTNFLNYYRLPQDTPVRFTSQVWEVSGVEVDGQRCLFPALEKDGSLLIPIDFVFQASGGISEYHWTDYSFSLTCGGKKYTLYKDGTLVEHLTDGENRVVDENCRPIMPFSYTYTLQYLSAEDFERCFGIVFDYDAAVGCYVLQSS